MRIALTGSHGTGKTTLARYLAEKLCYPKITNRARDVADDVGIKYVTELRTDRREAMLFQYAVLVRQLAAESLYWNFISDRSTLDFLAYWQVYGLGKDPAYRELCLGNRYDLLIYVPVEFPPAPDKFRDTDPDFQREVDRRIWELLQLVPWPVITVSGSVEERAQQVIGWLNGRKGVVTNAPRTS